MFLGAKLRKNSDIRKKRGDKNKFLLKNAGF